MEESELIKRYSIDIEALKREQTKLSKSIQAKDIVDFSTAERIGAAENIIVGNQIISVIIVCDKEFNIIEQQYFLDKLRFPYLARFRSYREIPAMVGASEKLNEKLDVILIHGHGTTHPQLGLASHFSLLTGIPAIGVAEDLFEENKIENEDILLEKKIVGSILKTKEKANPLYISPGDKISLSSALTLIRGMIKPPHKLPEPLHLAHKYAKEVREELKI